MTKRTSGLLDLQVNGYAGVDFNDAGVTPDALDHALHAMLRDGVTRCLPTLITATPPVLEQRLAALDRAIRGGRLGPIMVPGYPSGGTVPDPAHGYAGCHPAAAMIAPDPDVLKRLISGSGTSIRLADPGPGTPGSDAADRLGTAAGIVVAMGHTAADHDTVGRAADAGVSLSTHLGNALPQPQPKFLNPLIAQLAEDRMRASFIADGIHIPPSRARRAAAGERSGAGAFWSPTPPRPRPPILVFTISPACGSSTRRTDRCGSLAATCSPDRRYASIRRCAMSWPGGSRISAKNRHGLTPSGRSAWHRPAAGDRRVGRYTDAAACDHGRSGREFPSLLT